MNDDFGGGMDIGLADRSTWGQRETIAPVYEVGRPLPLSRAMTFEKGAELRNTSCARISACLDYAVFEGWHGLDCSGCPHWED